MFSMNSSESRGEGFVNIRALLLFDNGVVHPEGPISRKWIPGFSVNLKTLGYRSRHQRLAIGSNNFKFAHEPLAIYVEQEPHGDFVVIEILSFHWNAI